MTRAGRRALDRPAARGRLLGLLRTVTLRQALLAAAAVVVLASGLFGGLRRAEPEGLASLEAGQRFHVEPFDLTIERGRWLTDLGGDVDAPRGRYVALVATIENTSDHPVYATDVRNALRVQGLEGTYARSGDEITSSAQVEPQVLVVADGTVLSSAAPGVAYEVVFLWDQSTEVAAPTAVEVVARQQTWRLSNVDEQELWFDPAPARAGTVAVQKASETSTPTQDAA